VRRAAFCNLVPLSSSSVFLPAQMQKQRPNHHYTHQQIQYSLMGRGEGACFSSPSATQSSDPPPAAAAAPARQPDTAKVGQAGCRRRASFIGEPWGLWVLGSLGASRRGGLLQQHVVRSALGQTDASRCDTVLRHTRMAACICDTHEPMRMLGRTSQAAIAPSRMHAYCLVCR